MFSQEPNATDPPVSQQTRPLERKSFQPNFKILHDLSRHTTHSSETLSVAVNTIEALSLDMISRPQSLSPAATTNQQDAVNTWAKQMETRRELQGLRFQVQTLKALQARSESNHARLLNEINLVSFAEADADAQSRADASPRQAFNTVAQRDSHASVLLSEAMSGDSRAMRQIAFVTLLFLPPTFVSVRASRLALFVLLLVPIPFNCVLPAPGVPCPGESPGRIVFDALQPPRRRVPNGENTVSARNPPFSHLSPAWTVAVLPSSPSKHIYPRAKKHPSCKAPRRSSHTHPERSLRLSRLNPLNPLNHVLSETQPQRQPFPLHESVPPVPPVSTP